jgi:hypothetical protein
MSNLNLTPDQSGVSVGSFDNPFRPPAVPSAPITPPAALSEFQYVSQFAVDPIGVIINVSGVPQDVGAVVVAMYPIPMPGTASVVNTFPGGSTFPGALTDPGYSPVFMRTATEPVTGIYQTNFLASDTSVPGNYRIDWTFTLAEVTQTISVFVQVGPASPAYDYLPWQMKQVIEDVWIKFADGYDSPYGGPNLQMWYQSHYGRGRIAQLLKQAIQHLNNVSQPQNYYTVDGNGGGLFPVQQWSGLLNTALTIEVIKQLMRSYVEDPDIQGAVQARMIRRDYMQRWGSMLELEQAEMKSQLDTFKIRQMFKQTVLVAGGAYPNYGMFRNIALGGWVPRSLMFTMRSF